MTTASRTAAARLSLRQRALGRVLIALTVAVAAGLLVPGHHGLAFHVVVAWDAGLITLLVQAWMIILRYTPEQTRRRAAADDPGRNTVWAVMLVSSTMCLVAANWLVRDARTLAPRASVLLVLLALLAVILAWFTVHTAYTLRYAHLYYRASSPAKCGGLTFPGTETPADIDFAYYAFTVGMTFQVSDVVVTSSSLRRATLGHALLSFLFNTGILAVALNLIFTSLS